MIAKFADIRTSMELSSTAKLVAETLERGTKATFQESLLASQTIADRIGRSVRTVQLALRELARAGLVVVKRCRRWLGRVVNSGHVISLLWRPKPLFSGATDCAGPAQETAPEVVPPRPPIEEPEGNSKGEADEEPAAPALSAESSSASVSQAPTIKKTSPEFQALVSEAEKILGPGNATRQWVERKCREFRSFRLVDYVVRRCVGKPMRDPHAYLQGALARRLDEGGVPDVPAPPTPMTDGEWIARLDAVEAEREAFNAACIAAAEAEQEAFIASLGH